MSTKVSLYEETSTFVIEPWNVILINDNRHTFDEVIAQLIKATGCSLDQAREITWQVHTQGEAICYTGPRERCEHAASILEEIELRVRLERV